MSESETLGRRRILPHGGRDLVLQIGLFASLQLAYEIVRGQVDGAAMLAFAHGQAIIGIEQDLGIDIERAVQDWTLGQGGAVLWVANQTYLNCQFSISFCFVLWVYIRRNWAYLRLRNTLLAAEVLGLVGYLALPTAPPRFLGYIDTLDETVYSLNEGPLALLANPYAAMPSLHSAFAIAIGVTGVLVCRSLPARVVWGLYPVLVWYSIMATGNHFLLDALVGALVLAAAAIIGFAVTEAAERARRGEASTARRSEATARRH